MKKKAPEQKTAKFFGQFKAAENDDGAVIIEGIANKAVVDRGNDIIPPEAWDLDNFLKNPVILYNHGMDPIVGSSPVGRAVDIKTSEEGLRIKVRLSKSEARPIKMVRDLVEERMLQAFSVGFDPKDSVEKDEDGRNVIKQAELFEVSIVGVPMNQDSIFEISGKSLTNRTIDQIGAEVCARKGAWVAAELHKAIDLKSNDQGRDEIMEVLAEKSGLTKDDLINILSGDGTELKDETLQAFAEFLSLDIEALKGMDKGEGDEEEEEEEGEEAKASESEDEEDGEEDKTKQGMDEDSEDEESDEKSEEKQSLVIQSLVLSKDRFDTAEEAKEWADGNNFKSDKVDETDETFRLRQREPGAFKEGSFKTVDVTDGVSAVMGVLLEVDAEEGEDEEKSFQATVIENIVNLLAADVSLDDAVPKAIHLAEQVFNETEKSKDDYALFFDVADRYEKQADQGVPDVPTTPVKTDADASDFGSPQIELMKQSNVLLGALINEIQGLRSQIQQLAIPAVENESEEDESDKGAGKASEDDDNIVNDEEEESSESEKALLKKHLSDLNDRLKAIGA